MNKRILGAVCLLLCALFLFSACRGAVPAHDTSKETTLSASLPASAEPATGKPSSSGGSTASASDAPTFDAPTSGTPTSDTPTTDGTPTDETPTDETPTDETPTDETPTSESPTPDLPLTVDRMTVENVEGRLYRLNGSGAESVQHGILYGKYLITLNIEDGKKVISRDLTSGDRKVLYEPEDFSYGRFVKTDRGGFLLTDIDGLCVWFKNALDDEPEVLRETVYPEEDSEEWIDCTYLPDGTRTVRNGKHLTVENVFEEGALKVTIPEKYPYVTLIGSYGDKLAFLSTVYDETMTTYFLTLDREGIFEEIARRPGSSYFISNSGEIFNESPSGDVELLSLPELAVVKALNFRTAWESRYFSNGRYLVTSYYLGEYAIQSIYDYDSLLYFSSEIPFGYSSVLDEENDLVLLICSMPYDGEGDDPPPSDTLCFIDLTDAVGEEAPDYDQLLADKIAELEAAYPVRILTGDDALIDFPGFVGESMKNAVKLYEAVLILEKVFGDFPDGFFDELFSDEDEYYVNGLTVCLTGSLAPTAEDTISNPAAYAYTGDDMQYIVADASYTSSLRSTFAHELMHAIDYYLSWVVPTEVYPQWHHYVAYMSLYNYGYVDEDGNDFSDYSYTVSDPGKEWFIDSYSKTYPLEDRARLFENLFCYEENDCWFARYGRIVDRMEYMTGVIRTHFVSVQNSPEKPIWERAIDEVRARRGE